MRNRNFLFSLLLVCVWPISSVYAGFTIYPLKVFLTAEEKVATITITNNTNVTKNMQIDAYAWQRIDGKDVYQETNELIAVPPIFEIEPSGSQMIRIALRGDHRQDISAAYRISVKDLPNDKVHKTNGLNFLLEFLLPVFTIPENKMNGEVECRLENNKQIVCQNDSNYHHAVGNVAVYNPEGKVIHKETIHHYIFPQSTSVMPIKKSITDYHKIELEMHDNQNFFTKVISKNSDNE